MHPENFHDTDTGTDLPGVLKLSTETRVYVATELVPVH